LLLAVFAASLLALITFSTRRVLARKQVTQVACTQCGTVSTCLISEFNFEEAIDRLADNKPRLPAGPGDQEFLTPDQDAPTGAIPSADSGFVAPDQAPPVEDLREWVRLRLAQAASAEEVAAQLVQQGVDSKFATELVHSVISVGGAREVVLGESVAFDGNSPIFYANLAGEKLLRLQERRARRDREAREKAGESPPNPDFRFDESAD
jgi:hypothetical protein